MQWPLNTEGLLSGALLFCLLTPGNAGSAVLRPVWQPNGPVEALLLRGGTLYLGGTFSALQSPDGLSTVARSNLAALDWTSGAPLAWNPGSNGPVYALATQGFALFAGGNFSWAGGLTLSALAELDLTGDNARVWDPGANGAVRSLASNGGTLFVGGDFSQIGGVARQALAEIDTATPVCTAFDAQLSGTAVSVRALAVTGNLLFAGGSFSSALSNVRAGLAALNKTNGSLSAWNPAAALAPNPWFYTLLPFNGALWVGGSFSGSLGGAPVQGLAALDLSTGQATWAPAGPDAAVLDLAPDANGRLHAAGLFAAAAGQPRLRYASYFQSVPLLDNAYSANVSGSAVRALVVNGTEVALGGQFTQVDAQGVTNLAVLSLPPLGPVPTATPGNVSTAATLYVFPQPGLCGDLKVAVPFVAPGQATLRLRSVLGTLVKTQQVVAAAAGELRQSLDCAGLEPGLYWLETEILLRDGSVTTLPLTRFVLLER